MSRARRAWEQVGGRSALSKWSWIVTLPLALVVGSIYATTPSLSEVLVWTGVIVLVHCVAGLLMWLAWLTVLPHRERRSRPITAIVVFAGLGLARGLLMQLAQDSLGIGGGVFVERMGVNIVGTVVVLAAIAVVVDDYRVDLDIRQRLAQATQTLDAVREHEEAVLRAADVEVLRSVQQSVEAALRESGSDVDRVRRAAEQIVRPMSHVLADSAAEVDVALAAPDVRARSVRFTEAFAAVAAPSPILVAVLVELSVIGAVVSRFGLRVAIANALVGGGLILLGAWLLQRFLPLPARVTARIVVLLVAFALLGAVAATITSAIVEALVAPFPIVLPGVMAGTASAALVVSLGSALLAGRRQRLDQMAETVGASAAEVERLRTHVEDRRLQAARFLHGPIQADLLAAAMRGEEPEAVREAIARRFAEYGEGPRRPVEQQVADVIEAWSSVLDVSVTVDREVWKVLDADPVRAELIVDALSEGLTNAVRHASSNTVEVVGEVRGRTVQLNVVSAGVPDPRGSGGIGLAQLRSRGAVVDLVSTGDRTLLTVAA